jgi:L-ascorbate metabolism protein UlaG (beta-lactamase superfamily)
MTNITYAGHSTVFIESEGFNIVIDPWLDTNPLCPDSLKNPNKLDLIILTHGHSDHSSDALRLSKHLGATVVATYELAMLLKSEGVPEGQLCPMNKGGSVKINNFNIVLTNALHSNSYDKSDGTYYAGEACGVILKNKRNAIYYAGDTALFSDMRLIAELYQPDLAFLPIGDRFTMGPKEAAIATTYLKVPKVIPIHHSTFPLLTGTVEDFEKELSNINKECKSISMKAGEYYNLA